MSEIEFNCGFFCLIVIWVILFLFFNYFVVLNGVFVCNNNFVLIVLNFLLVKGELFSFVWLFEIIFWCKLI